VTMSAPDPRWRVRSWRRSSLSPHTRWYGGLCSPVAFSPSYLPGQPNQADPGTCVININSKYRTREFAGGLPPPERPSSRLRPLPPSPYIPRTISRADSRGAVIISAVRAAPTLPAPWNYAGQGSCPPVMFRKEAWEAHPQTPAKPYSSPCAF